MCTFSIDENTGQLIVARALDRERQQAYTLEVGVRDSGQPPLASATVLEVLIGDGLIFVSSPFVSFIILFIYFFFPLISSNMGQKLKNVIALLPTIFTTGMGTFTCFYCNSQ